MLPKEIFDIRKSKTRDPKRKFAAKQYLMDIGRKTQVIDLKTHKGMNLESAVDKFGIIDVQLLDFTGSIFLDNTDWEVQPGFNKLFLKKINNNESLLLEHKVKLSRYMRSYDQERSMEELQQLMKFGEFENDKFIKFRYSCLEARILMRQRKLDSAKSLFEETISFLHREFTEVEREQ